MLRFLEAAVLLQHLTNHCTAVASRQVTQSMCPLLCNRCSVLLQLMYTATCWQAQMGISTDYQSDC